MDHDLHDMHDVLHRNVLHVGIHASVDDMLYHVDLLRELALLLQELHEYGAPGHSACHVYRLALF